MTTNWYTITEAAKLLNSQPQAIRAYIRRFENINSLCEKRGGIWIISLEAIELLRKRPGPGKPKNK